MMCYDIRITEYLLGFIDCHNLSGIQHHDLICASGNTFHFMVYHDDGNSVLIQIFYNIEDFLTSQRIQLSGTLVQYKDLGFHNESGTERYSLYLAT